MTLLNEAPPTMLAALVCMAILQVADVWTTLRFLRNGTAREANPIIARLMRLPGPIWILVKLGVAGGLSYGMLVTGAVAGLWAVNALYLWVVIRNYRVGTP